MKQILAVLFTGVLLLAGIQLAEANPSPAGAHDCCEQMHQATSHDCSCCHAAQSCDTQCQCDMHCATGGHALSPSAACSPVLTSPATVSTVLFFSQHLSTPYLKQPTQPPRV